MAASTAVFLEYEEVLKRDEQRAVHRRNTEQIDVPLSTLSGIVVPVDIYFQWRPQLPDDDDEMVLDAAINGRVDAIVTHNLKHLLPAGVRFGIGVVTPAQFLHEVKR